MEALQRTPSKITKTFLKLHRNLQEVEAEIVQFTNLPTDTPSLDLLAQHIAKKLSFLRNFLNAEVASYGSVPGDLLEIEARLVKLEAEFYISNLRLNNVQENDESENGSVCDSCMNNDSDLQREERSDVSSVYEDSEMLYDVVMPPPPHVDMFNEPIMPICDLELSCEREKTGGGGKRRWLRTVAVVTTVSAVLTMSLSSYFENRRHEGFLIPT